MVRIRIETREKVRFTRKQLRLFGEAILIGPDGSERKLAVVKLSERPRDKGRRR